MAQASGALIVSRPAGSSGSFREESLSFQTLEELLSLCAAEQGRGAFVRVHVTGEAGGRRQRLVLDFGHFGSVAPAGARDGEG
jgi:hypothetical protein